MIYLKLILTAIFWGGTFIAGRVAAADMGPFSAAFMRFAIASIFLILSLKKIEGKIIRLKKHQILPVFLLGIFGIFGYNVLFFKGLSLIHAGRASLIIATNPIVISILSAFFFKERLTCLKISGILLSVLGAVVVITNGSVTKIMEDSIGLGDVFIFGCVLTWAIYTLIGKSVMNELSPLVIVTYSSLIGALALLPPALYNGLINDIKIFSSHDWFSLFYLAFFGTVLGFIWFYQGVGKIGPTKASLFINLVPVSAIILAFLFLDEPVTISLLTGALLVATGIYLTNNSKLFKQIDHFLKHRDR